VSKTITISDVRPISLTISSDGGGKVSLSVRYVRLNENGDPIEGFTGTLSTEVTGDVKSHVVDFVQNKVVPWIRQQEGIE